MKTGRTAISEKSLGTGPSRDKPGAMVILGRRDGLAIDFQDNSYAERS